MESVVSELEGTLLKDKEIFSYFMLVAFETSGIIRFAFLLVCWPVFRLMDACGKTGSGLKLMVFVATAGVPLKQIELVSRAVLAKFYYDDLDLEAWRSFISSGKKRVVVTKMPRVMVEWFVKEHLLADHVIGSELISTCFGLATGFVREADLGSMILQPPSTSFLPLNKEHMTCPLNGTSNEKQMRHNKSIRPPPVIFHDGRLVPRPTPLNALLILLWIPFGIIIVVIRISIGLVSPLWFIPFLIRIFGGKVIVKGRPPPPATQSNSGVLFVSTHRTLLDPGVLSLVLQRRIPATTYSISRFSEIISPIPIVRLKRIREVDAATVKRELSKGDLVVCPEGTTCREPFLLRFSALFAELTDQIVPVAMNYEVPFFHATTARGWKALDPIFLFMNPCGVYEITFLDQLPSEATCSSGRGPHEVANYVQGILAKALGFECTNLTRKDKYRVLTGNDGSVWS